MEAEAGADNLTAQIRMRAVEVAELGAYLGLFDLLVYAWSSKRLVMVCFGTEVVDVLRVFSPVLRDAIPLDAKVFHFVAARWRDGRSHVIGDAVLPV